MDNGGWHMDRNASAAPPAGTGDLRLRTALQENLRLLQTILSGCSDVVFRHFRLGTPAGPAAALVYVDGMVDRTAVDRAVLDPLMGTAPRVQGAQSLAQVVHDLLLPKGEVRVVTNIEQVVDQLMRGSAALLIDGEAVGLLAGTQGWEVREISEPITEGAVRGPRDGFTEHIRTNTALIRVRLPTPSLKFIRMQVGQVTRTEVVVAYLDGIANLALVQEVQARLSRIQIDGILESGYLEEFIEDTPWSPFPQIEHTERPDKVAGCLLDGRVAILTDNTPFVLLVPTTLPQFLQASEDYYERFWYSSMIRWVRFAAWAIALLLPATYVALTTYQPELIPPSLLVSLAAAREGVPFPAVVEALLMEVSLEVLREAGVRLPRPVGQAVSIVGGLVIGESAVRAAIASPAMVIVVSLTAIASFSNPAYNFMNGVRLLRFGMMALAATFGLPGLMWGVLLLHVHLATLRSFGVPYLSPLGPVDLGGLKDVVVRVPWWAMRRRPRFVGGKAPQRQPAGQGPRVPQGR